VLLHLIPQTQELLILSAYTKELQNESPYSKEHLNESPYSIKLLNRVSLGIQKNSSRLFDERLPLGPQEVHDDALEKVEVKGVLLKI